MELDERVRLLAVQVNAHQSCGSTMELLKELQSKISKDYVPKKEILKLKTEQERKISKVKMESEKKLADKFQDLNKLLSQQVYIYKNYFLVYSLTQNIKINLIFNRWINKKS